MLGCGGLEYDKAVITTEYGGSVLLEGSDLGDTLDVLPNSWMYRMLRLPQDAKKLSVAVIPGENANTNFRIRLLYEENGEVKKAVLQDGFDGNVDGQGYFLLRSAGVYEFDISAYAGKKVLLTLEQDDNGEGSGEMVNVYAIKIFGKDAGSDSGTEWSTNAEILLAWNTEGTIFAHPEGICLEAKDGESSVSGKFVVTERKYLKFYIRTFVRDGETDPQIQAYVNDAAIVAIGQDAETIRIESDLYCCVLFDLSDYVGDEITFTLKSVSGDHACIAKIVMSDFYLESEMKVLYTAEQLGRA